MVLARVKLENYTNKVLRVVKAKYDLNDKSEAINKFVELYGEKEVEKEPKEEYLKKILEIDKKHMKKYGNKRMSLKELDKLCGVS